MERTDAELFARSLVDPAVFGEIFDRHASTLLRFFMRRVGTEVGESLFGELFRIAFERRGRFDSSRASARPWLYGIATNLMLKHRRSEGRRLRATAELAIQRESIAASESSTQELDARILWPKVATAIAALSDGERDVLLLFAWEEQSYDDIASALEIPLGTVRSRLNRARTRLRELVQPDRNEPAEPASEPGRVRR